MNTVWDKARICSYITGKIEESVNLDYKAAGALAKEQKKTTEITKDVSSFANSGGGVIIYGVRQFDAKNLSHLPEKIDPIDRREFNKEWLEHIISTIQPRPNVIIHSVQLSSAPDHVVYVVEVAAGRTAHQANDCRYYKSLFENSK
jgi:predicted HTH transcriptional regulator